MPIQVLCPTCHKELAAPDELAGRVAECPYCKNRFQVGGGGDAGASATGKAGPTETVKMPLPTPRGGTGQRANPGGSVSMKGSAPAKSPTSESSPADPPPAIARTGNVEIKIPPPPPSTHQSSSPRKPTPGMSPPIATTPPTNSPPTNAPSSSVPPTNGPPVTSSPPNSRPAPPKVKKRMNRAVFKTADTAKSQVHLGADGRLPELLLEEGMTKERPNEERKQTNPLVLMAILGFSVSISVLLLLYEGETAQSEHRAKAEARQIINQRYLSKAPLEPYQVLLREAQQAHAQGNSDLERSRYRRVLDMLHAEDKNKNEGLTGLAEPSLNSRDAPNDRELENLLSKLLAAE